MVQWMVGGLMSGGTLKGLIRLCVLAVVMCSAMVREGTAQVAVWDAGGGVDTNWDTYTNWDGDADPGLVEVQFGSAGTEATMNVSDAVGSVTFNRLGNFDIAAGSGTLTINNGITTTTANNFSIAAPVTLGSGQIFDVFGGSTLTLSGAIGDGGNGYALTKAGSGTLTLSGVNTYTGGTTVSAGTLSIDTGGSIGVSSGNAVDITGDGVTINNSGTITGEASGIYYSNTPSNATVTNSGTLNATSTTSNRAVAIELRNGSGNSIINTGDIAATGPTVWGLIIYGDDATITNSGTVTLTPTTGGWSPGLRIANGNNATLRNDGTVTMDLSSLTTGVGFIDVMSTQNATGSMINNGTLTAHAPVGSSGEVYGMWANNASTSIINTGDIDISGPSYRTAGISVSGSVSNSVSNSGTITVSTHSGSAGQYDSGIFFRATDCTLDNSGSITTSGDATHGIRISSNSGQVIQHSGSITTDGVASHGMAGGSGVDITLQNGSTIDINGADSHGINGTGTMTLDAGSAITLAGDNNTGIVETGGGTIDHSGSIRFSGVSGYGDGIVIGAGSTIDHGGITEGKASGSDGGRAIVMGAAGTETGMTLNVMSGSQFLGDVENEGAADGATVNFGVLSGGGADSGFSETFTNDFSGNTMVANFVGGTTTLGGTTNNFSTSTVSSGATLVSSGYLSGNVVNNGDVVFDPSASATYAGVMSGTGALTKTGTGTLTLSGTNTYSGGTAINDGTVSIGAVANLGAAGSGLTFGGGTLHLTNAIDLTDDITLDTGGGTVESDVSNTLSGVVGGTGALVKQGTGTLTLSGTNTYTGGTTINAGTLIVSGGDALANTGAVSIAAVPGAILQLNADETIGSLSGGSYPANGKVDLQANTLTVGDANNTTFAGNITGTGTLIKQGSGRLRLSGRNDGSFTGETIINAGTMIAEGYGLGTSDITLADVDGVTLQSSGTSVSVVGSIAGGGSNGGNIILINTLQLDGSQNTTFNGVISGTGILRRLGTGITTLTGNNTYSGGTILGGTLILGHDNALGTGTLNMDSSGDPTLQSNNDARSISNAIALGGNGLTVSGANNLALGGVVSGTGSLTKSGTGTLMLSGTNTYTGGTTIDGGTLIASGGNAIGDMGTVAIADATGATLQLDADETIGSLSGGGSTGGEVNLQANTLTAGDAGNTTFAGVISGTGALVKQGTGTLTLSGANTYTGGTTLNGGTLSLANSNALGTGGITVLGSTIDYADGLNIANTIDLQNDATLNVSTGSATQSGDIGETGGSWGIIKTGAGTLILSGTNTYTGGTTINAGTLIASGGNAIGDMGTVAIADVAGATLQLDADETIGSLSGGGTTGGEVNLQANTLTTGDAGNTTFSGVISGTGALTKIGTGTLTLSGTNTYSGGTTLNAGTLIASGGNAIGDMGTVAIADVAGATLQLDADETIGSLSGGGTTGGEVNLQANTLTVGNAGNTTFSGVISGTGALVKQGTGTLTLTGEQQYTGRTAIEQGTLRLAGGADPFVLDFTSTGGTINDAQGEGTGFTQRLDGTFSSTIDAGLDLDTDNARLRITSGGPADFHGELSLGLIEAPGVNLSDLGLGACSDFTIVANFEDAPFPNPHRQYGVYVGDSAYRLIRGGFLTVLTGDIFGVNNSSGTNADTDINYTNVGAPTIGGSVDVILSRIGGVFSLSVNGVDVMPTVQLSELNSLDDLTLGVFSLHTSGTTGAFTVPLTQFSVESPELNSLLPKLHEATAVSIAAGATLDLNGTSQTIASITGDAGSRVLLGNIAGKTFTIAGDDGATRFDGEISGAGHLEKTGNATLTLGGANTYTGGTTLNGGTLSLANSNALGTGGITVLGSTIDYADGLNIANTIDLQNDATLNVSTGSATQSGDIGETGGSWGIIKTGAGTLILSGTNTYTGGTTINAGTLYSRQRRHHIGSYYAQRRYDAIWLRQCHRLLRLLQYGCRPAV